MMKEKVSQSELYHNTALYHYSVTMKYLKGLKRFSLQKGFLKVTAKVKRPKGLMQKLSPYKRAS